MYKPFFVLLSLASAMARRCGLSNTCDYWWVNSICRPNSECLRSTFYLVLLIACSLFLLGMMFVMMWYLKARINHKKLRKYYSDKLKKFWTAKIIPFDEEKEYETDNRLQKMEVKHFIIDARVKNKGYSPIEILSHLPRYDVSYAQYWNKKKFKNAKKQEISNWKDIFKSQPHSRNPSGTLSENIQFDISDSHMNDNEDINTTLRLHEGKMHSNRSRAVLRNKIQSYASDEIITDFMQNDSFAKTRPSSVLDSMISTHPFAKENQNKESSPPKLIPIVEKMSIYEEDE